MPSVGAITKTIRLNAEDREYIESLMLGENLTWSGAIHKVISERGTPQNGSQKNRGNKKEGQGTPYDEIRDLEIRDLRYRLQELRTRCKGEKATELFDSKLYSHIQIEPILGGEGTPHRQDLMDRAVERDIGNMCKASGISTHDFYRGVCELFNEGQIGIEEGKVKSYGEYDMKDFEMVCYKLRERPEKMLEKLTRSLERNV